MESNANNLDSKNNSTMTADNITINTNTNTDAYACVFSTMTKTNGLTTHSQHKTVPINHDDDDHLKEGLSPNCYLRALPLKDCFMDSYGATAL
jgi:hypothetical protein